MEDLAELNSLEYLTSEYTSSLSSIGSSIIQYLPLGTGRLTCLPDLIVSTIRFLSLSCNSIT